MTVASSLPSPLFLSTSMLFIHLEQFWPKARLLFAFYVCASTSAIIIIDGHTEANKTR